MPEIGAGYKTFGKASRSMINREKKTNMWENIISDVGSAGIFAAGKIKESKTAWEDYETGYKARGGDVADIEKRGSFWKQAGQTLMPGGDKGFFQMPEGEARIGNTMYDRSKLQKAGSFLSSDASAVLDEGARAKYLERTAPGREAPKLQQPTNVPVSTPSVSGVVPKTPQFPTQDYEQTVSRPESFRLSEKGDTMIAGRTEPIQESEYGGVDPKPRGPNLGSMWSKFNKFIEAKGPVSGGGTGVMTGVSQIPEDKGSYQNMLNAGTAQDSYTNKQRQPYLENTQKSFWDTSFLSRNKHDSGGGETGWLTGFFNQDENEYDGR